MMPKMADRNVTNILVPDFSLVQERKNKSKTENPVITCCLYSRGYYALLFSSIKTNKMYFERNENELSNVTHRFRKCSLRFCVVNYNAVL